MSILNKKSPSKIELQSTTLTNTNITFKDNDAEVIYVDGEYYQMSFWDTFSHKDWDRLRPLSYPQTDIFLLCIDISNIKHYDEITEKWLPEIQHHMPATPIIIVGCKSDLRGMDYKYTVDTDPYRYGAPANI